MRKMLLRPGWVVTHLVVIAIAVAFVSLGLWQINRHGERQLENERITAQLAADPVPVEEALTRPDPDLLPVRATGRYVQDADVTLSPRSRNDRPGFEILTPLALDGGEVLLVNRGWMPLDSEIPAPASQELTVEGRLRTPQRSRQVLTDDDGTITLVSSVDLERLAGQVDGLEGTAYLERVDAAEREAGALPRPADPITTDAGPHLSYAAQWFAFTIIGLVGYPLLLRRRLADAAGPDSPDGPDGPTGPEPSDRPTADVRMRAAAPVASSDPT